MSILEELYHGEVNPQSSHYINDDRLTELMSIVSDTSKALDNILYDKDKQLLTELTNASSELLTLSEMEFFIKGWQLCAQFMIDTFSLK